MTAALCIIILVLVADNYDRRRKGRKLETEHKHLRMDHRELKSRIRSLLWNIAHQREKVQSTLYTMADLMHDRPMTEELKAKMMDEVMRNIR